MTLGEIEVCKARLRHYSKELEDIPGAVEKAFQSISGGIHPGMRIAIAVGSRGISNLSLIVSSLITELKKRGAIPFIVPAMGSHGGGTADGQRQVLEGYGLTEQVMGVPILSAMEVETIGSVQADGGERLPVYMDKHAASADGIIVVNRVKSHTDFHGPHESGIVKILVIGLGKQVQAVAVHRHGADGLRDYIPMIAKSVLQTGKVLGALAILEDGYDRTSEIACAAGDEIFQLDAKFLSKSKLFMPRLPFDRLDVLVVDKMGKEISGTGMDTNVIGRLCIRGQPDGSPHCGRIAVLDLSESSHGNALGVGLADVTTQRLADKINWETTNANVITSGFLERGFLPVVEQSDYDAVSVAVKTCGLRTPETLRLARIRNTLQLDELYVTRALLSEAGREGGLEQCTPFAPLRFGQDGSIEDF